VVSGLSSRTLKAGIFKMLLLLLVDDKEQLHYLHHLLLCFEAVWDRE
jgi:hypothetical protein